MTKVALFSGPEHRPSVTEAIMETATLAVAQYPTSEPAIRKEPSEPGGRVSYVQPTSERHCLVFQTVTGSEARGKGSFTVPVEEFGSAVEALQGLDIDNLNVESEGWLPVDECIRQTARRIEDEDGNEYVSFRTRMGKGSKSINIPVDSWTEFVNDILPALSRAAEGQRKKLEQLAEKAAAKAAAKAE